MMPTVPSQEPITVQGLTYVLFGNPINPQDKGIIGTLQDTQRQLVRLAWALLITFIAAVTTAVLDLIVNHHF